MGKVKATKPLTRRLLVRMLKERVYKERSVQSITSAVYRADEWELTEWLSEIRWTVHRDAQYRRQQNALRTSR